ncbi:hypothetical protein DH2020_025768 [Rehmannia glutinosa]|uniref:BAH domain-containing protein n=1 Tax=Rehmannia glutinosa TaxID=99300 RepID=A0ABR0W2M1_REHGL
MFPVPLFLYCMAVSSNPGAAVQSSSPSVLRHRCMLAPPQPHRGCFRRFEAKLSLKRIYMCYVPTSGTKTKINTRIEKRQGSSISLGPQKGNYQFVHIGKLVRIWETESREKKVEVLWFFRPTEIVHWLGDIKPFQREIFLACGHGEGLSNPNPLEAISGKCNVVCSSKHKRNPQPTEEELRMADYIFYRTFDVGKYIISEKFPSSIGGIEAEYLCKNLIFHIIATSDNNASGAWSKDTKPSVCAEPKAHSKVRSEETPVRAKKNDQPARLEKVAHRYGVPATPSRRQINNSTNDGPSAGDKVKNSERFLSASTADAGPLKKRKLLVHLGPRDAALPCPPSRDFGHERRMGAKDSCREKKDLFTRVSLDEKAKKFAEKGAGKKQHVSPGMNYKYMEVTRRPGMDSSKWFKIEVSLTPCGNFSLQVKQVLSLPAELILKSESLEKKYEFILTCGVWEEERLHEMNEKGTLVLLENLDPSFTSAEVEDIVWRVFEQKVKAKMIPRTTFSSPHSGQAFAIFKTKEAADHVISKLANGCLTLGDGRPIVARRRGLSKSGVSGVFAGHLRIDRTRPQRQREDMVIPATYQIRLYS